MSKKGVTSPRSRNKTALEPLVILDPEAEYGPAMSRLTDTRKRFVIAHVLQCGRNDVKAAEWAGIGGTYNARKRESYKLMHDPNVLEAIREHTDVFFKGGILRCAHGLMDLTEDDNPKIRLEAIKAWLGYAGVIVAAQQNIRVTHEIEHVPLDELDETVRKYYESLPKLTHVSGLSVEKLDSILSERDVVFQEGVFDEVDDVVVELRQDELKKAA